MEIIDKESLSRQARVGLTRPARPDSTSGFKGVRFLKGGKSTVNDRYFSNALNPCGGRIHLGSFDTKEDAAKCYDEYVRKVYGKWVWTNFLKNGKPRKVKIEKKPKNLPEM